MQLYIIIKAPRTGVMYNQGSEPIAIACLLIVIVVLQWSEYCKE